MTRQVLPAADLWSLIAEWNVKRSRHQRKAVRVLPVPVGARMRGLSPRAMAGQPSRCGVVGAPRVERNQSRVRGWKRASGPEGVAMVGEDCGVDFSAVMPKARVMPMAGGRGQCTALRATHPSEIAIGSAWMTNTRSFVRRGGFRMTAFFSCFRAGWVCTRRFLG